MDEENPTWETVEVFCALRTLFAWHLSVSAAHRGSLRPPGLSCQVKGNLGFYFESHGLNLTRKKKPFTFCSGKFQTIIDVRKEYSKPLWGHHSLAKLLTTWPVVSYTYRHPFPVSSPWSKSQTTLHFIHKPLGEGRKQLTNTKTVSRKTPEMTQIGSHWSWWVNFNIRRLLQLLQAH